MAVAPLVLALTLAGCGGSGSSARGGATRAPAPGASATAASEAGSPASISTGPTPASRSISPTEPTTAVPSARALPGMPPPLDPNDVYAADRPNQLSPAVRGDRPLVYVPNTLSDTVSVIDPATYKVIRTIRTGRQPQHVVPSWDLRTLWINNDLGNSLTALDPRTGKVGKTVRVHDPYNLYFTPDGKNAVVMASNDRQLVFRDPRSMAVKRRLDVRCDGVNHADFSPDGRYFIVSCEFDGKLLKVDTEKQTLTGVIRLPRNAKPQDVKIAPDGRTWYVADMQTSGVWLVDGDAFGVRGFLRTGNGAHGLYVSRDSKTLYVSNRGEGTISLLDLPTGRLRGKWRIPGGGSPDMGGVSADGKVLWLSGRYHGVVYAISTADGHLIAKIPVGKGPHGLAVWPQPGRYSLGHTGIFR